MIQRMAILVPGILLASLLSVAAADSTIIQKNRTFSVREITVKVGDHVVFVNNDTVSHNVYSETKGLEFEIELQPPGRSDAVRFSQPGTAEIECAIHPDMKLRVYVKP